MGDWTITIFWRPQWAVLRSAESNGRGWTRAELMPCARERLEAPTSFCHPPSLLSAVSSFLCSLFSFHVSSIFSLWEYLAHCPRLLHVQNGNSCSCGPMREKLYILCPSRGFRIHGHEESNRKTKDFFVFLHFSDESSLPNFLTGSSMKQWRACKKKFKSE